MAAVSHNLRLGRLGEDLAAAELERRGFTILARNVRTRYGELDLVASDGASTVIVEVKTRRGRAMGAPEEGIDARKQRHLLAAAQSYLQELGLLDTPWRIDAAAVEVDSLGQPSRIELIENAVHG